MPLRHLEEPFGILIFLILSAFLSNAVFPENPDLNGENRKNAVYFCSRAADHFKKKNFHLAEHFLKRCEYNDPEYINASPEALKIKAVIFFLKNDRFHFIFFGKKYAELRNDPFFAYILASEALRIRKSEDALFLLKKAVSGNTESSDSYGENYRGIFFCSIPASVKTGFSLESEKLSDRDLSLAMYQLTALSDILEKNSDVNAYKAGFKSLSRNEKDPYIKNLLEEPEKDAGHIRCIRNLENEAKTKKINLPREMRNEINGTLLLLFKNRSVFIKGAPQMFTLGSAYLDAGNYREALLTFRLVLEKSGWNQISGTSFPDRSFSEILRKIGMAYEQLQLQKDAVSVRRMADTIDENIRLNPLDFEYRKRLLNSAGENLKNREALLLLEADARWRKNKKAEYYQNRLIKRDREMEDTELLSILKNTHPY